MVLTSCQANGYYRNEAASGQGEKMLPLKKLMHKIVEIDSAMMRQVQQPARALVLAVYM